MEIKDFIKDKCCRILNAKDSYKADRKEFLRCVEQLEESDFWLPTIHEKAMTMQESYRKYQDLKFNVSQFAHVSGNEDIYNEIIENEEEKKEVCICETDFDFRKFIFTDDNGIQSIALSSSLKFPEKQRIRFCPMCGRRLSEINFKG